MKTLRYVLAVLGALSLLVVAVTGWVWTHRGYRGVVYYEAIAVVTSFDQRQGSQQVLMQDSIRLEEWVDPRAEVRREQLHGVRWHVLQRGSLEYTVRGPGDAFPVLVSRPARGVESWGTWRPLRDGGWSALGRSLLREAVGPVLRQRLRNRPALRFAVGLNRILADSQTMVWLDASTLAPLQYQGQSLTKVRYVETYDFVTRRLAPGTLPYDFFLPPRVHRASFWDRVGDWFQRHPG